MTRTELEELAQEAADQFKAPCKGHIADAYKQGVYSCTENISSAVIKYLNDKGILSKDRYEASILRQWIRSYGKREE